jgi:hypothetical protein
VTLGHLIIINSDKQINAENQAKDVQGSIFADSLEI